MERVYAIMGCTASGKAKLAAELARRHGGEILSVDSMKIYRRMDIGTAKASAELRAEIPHHGIDVVEPWEPFTVAQFVTLADSVIAACHASGRPIVASGGTGLYFKALVAGMFEGPGQSPEIRAELQERAQREGSAGLHGELARIDPEAAGRIHPNDLRRIVRALEVYRLTGTPISVLQQQWAENRPRYDFRMLWLRRGREDGNRRINARVGRMIEEGLVEEVEALLADPRGLTSQAAAALGYAEIIAQLRGRWSLAEAVEQIKINTRHFAKNQRTWFRHFQHRHGVTPLDAEPDTTVTQAADAAEALLGLR